MFSENFVKLKENEADIRWLSKLEERRLYGGLLKNEARTDTEPVGRASPGFDLNLATMNVVKSQTGISASALMVRRCLMTARQAVVEPIPCRKGKPRKLDKPVHPRKKLIAEKLMKAVESPYFLFFQYGSLKNTEWNDLRYELAKENIQVKVFPNKISAKVLEGTKYENFQVMFRSSTTTCFSSENNLKVLLKIMKSFPKLELMGGKVDNEFLSRKQVIEHGKLPAIETMQAQFSQLLTQSPQQLTHLLCQSQRQLSVNLEQYVSQNSKEEANL